MQPKQSTRCDINQSINLTDEWKIAINRTTFSGFWISGNIYSTNLTISSCFWISGNIYSTNLTISSCFFPISDFAASQSVDSGTYKT